MEALDLDPDGYGGTYKLIGGRLSLNFANTVSWPLTDRRHDWLTPFGNLRRWADAVGLDGREILPDDLASIFRARGTITQLLWPLAHGGRPEVLAVERFNDMLSSTSSRRSLDPSTLGWSWRDQTPTEALLDAIVFDAAGLASQEDLSRLNHCPSCNWAFYDETRNGRRRWCDMADCGSRSKSRSYYERTKTGHDSTPTL